MNSLFFGVGVLAFVIIIFWYVKNERAGDEDGTMGLLGTKQDADRSSSQDERDH